MSKSAKSLNKTSSTLPKLKPLSKPNPESIQKKSNPTLSSQSKPQIKQISKTNLIQNKSNSTLSSQSKPQIKQISKTNLIQNKSNPTLSFQSKPQLKPLKPLYTQSKTPNVELLDSCKRGDLDAAKKIVGASNFNECMCVTLDICIKYLNIVKYLTDKIDNIDDCLLEVLNHPELRNIIMKSDKIDMASFINVMYYDQLMSQLE